MKTKQLIKELNDKDRKIAKRLIKAIKEDVNGLLNYFDELRGGMLNRVNVLDFYDELNKILDEALK